MRDGSLLSLVALGALACSTGHTTFTGTPLGNGDGVAAGSGGQSSASATGPNPTPKGTCGQGGSGVGGGAATFVEGAGCSADAGLVYVFAENGSIYNFDPPSKQFTPIATPHCPAKGTPNSMAIDRNLVAWLNYVGGLYTFDLKTKTECNLALTLPTGFTQCGMGFASDEADGGTARTLYIDGDDGLARVDMTTMSVVPIGAFTNDPALKGLCELTGTGDARLFGYFPTTPSVRVAQLDKTNADALSDVDLTTFMKPTSAWAFTFWGGEFYMYASPSPAGCSPNSGVVHYVPSTGAVDLSYVEDTGLAIVGAGVTTCAPIAPPM